MDNEWKYCATLHPSFSFCCFNLEAQMYITVLCFAVLTYFSFIYCFPNKVSTKTFNLYVQFYLL